MKSKLPEIYWPERVLWLMVKHEIFEIEGESMSPTLIEGDLVLVNYEAELKPGDIVLAKHPFEEGEKLLKRIWKITPDGKYFLIGDNLPKSTDSRIFGELPASDILGKAEAKIKKLLP
jgi:nickel-type superoxide dismutase maturation protease